MAYGKKEKEVLSESGRARTTKGWERLVEQAAEVEVILSRRGKKRKNTTTEGGGGKEGK